ncbi:hypothetical protein H310_09854 [Aphanomyces invadans]|uniref:Uncharacterized protein n=1 Tax=Aphanomyces invadans TaxID=157072 RepID=A0A024TSP9_9STRA|nr:hypothetical protein H310_09854 [Aphanomyces invadans]ETV97019.1 hypothetical protein H310_09854 [Aphanomyces invadans]|eukprot:XP_008874265.1 hypothetical protein H310_09854 [Aphanomyces invadans]
MHAQYMHPPWAMQQRAMQQRQKQHMLRQSIRELQQTTLRDVVRDRNAAMLHQLHEIHQQLHNLDEQRKHAAMAGLLEQILHEQKRVEQLLDASHPSRTSRLPPHEPEIELPLAVAPSPSQQKEAEAGARQKLHQSPPHGAIKSAAPPPSRAPSRPDGRDGFSPSREQPASLSPPQQVGTSREQTILHQAKQDITTKDAPVRMLGVLFSEEEEQLLAIPEDDTDAADIVIAPTTKQSDAAAQELKRLESIRRKALLQHLSPSTTGLKRPKWRLDADAANGVVSTFGEAPMAPLQVFRSVAVAVLGLVRLQNLSLVRRRNLREEEKQVMANMIDVYVEATRSWMAKEMRVPVASVLQDPTMNFGTGSGGAKIGVKKKFGALLFANKAAPKPAPHALVQLKVRLKGIVDAVAKTTVKPQDTPDAIATFLRRLTTDGVYFPADFLTPDERRALEFNSLGATRNMDSAQRFNVVVLNFIVVRIVVPSLVLRPWEGPMASKATPPLQVQHNLRVLATALYTVCQQILPTVLLDAGSAAPTPDPSATTPPSQNEHLPNLARIPSMLYSKHVLPLDDVDFAEFLLQQQDNLQTWLLQLHDIVHSDQPLAKDTKTTPQPL